MRCRFLVVIAVLVALVAPAPAQAASWEFQGQGTGNWSHLRAEVEFAMVGDNLQVTLTNTMLAPFTVEEPTDVLTGVLFNFSAPGNPTLSKTGGSAMIAPGSSHVNWSNPPSDFAGNVGGEWGFRNDLSGGLPKYGMAASGLDSSGADLFGIDTLFLPGGSLTSPPAPGGVNWGLVNAGYKAGTGNGGVASDQFIRHSTIFTLTGLPMGFDLGTAVISDVQFRYGSSYGTTFPNFQGNLVPEPGSMTLLGLGAAALAGRRLRRRRAPAETEETP